MSLSYTQLDALTTDVTFLGRVRSAVADHAHYWESNPNATNSQLQWCQQVLINQRCAQIAANLARELVFDPAILNSTTGNGSDVTDVALKGAVDAICEKYT